MAITDASLQTRACHDTLINTLYRHSSILLLLLLLLLFYPR